MVNRDKKFLIKEGRAITNGNFAYGGFPRILNEEEQPEKQPATIAYRDSVTDPNPNVATQTNQQEGDSVEALYTAWTEAQKSNVDYNTEISIINHNKKMEAIKAARQMPKGRARNKAEFAAHRIPHPPEAIAERERLQQAAKAARASYEAHPGYAAHDKQLEELRKEMLRLMGSLD